MTSPVETVAYPIQRTQERDSVIVPTAEKNVIPLVTASSDMVQRSGKFKP